MNHHALTAIMTALEILMMLRYRSKSLARSQRWNRVVLRIVVAARTFDWSRLTQKPTNVCGLQEKHNTFEPKASSHPLHDWISALLVLFQMPTSWMQPRLLTLFTPLARLSPYLLLPRHHDFSERTTDTGTASQPTQLRSVKPSSSCT